MKELDLVIPFSKILEDESFDEEVYERLKQ